VPLELATISQKRWRGRVLLDQDFTLANLKAQRPKNPFGIIHLATHSEFLAGHISQSNIQLWPSELRLDPLNELGWGHPLVELVVLSACGTALSNSAAELGFAGFTVRSG
jgi:CHAT domain-containing protein